MEAHQLHRGRLIDHIQLVVANFKASKQFYEAVMQTLGIAVVSPTDDFFMADELGVSSADSEAAQGRLTGRVHLAFQAADAAQVKAFYEAALENGGQDNGAPGERPYHPGYFAAFVLDPDGNNIEVVYHGPAKRSATSVVIDFEM